jgi:hypothetical protein
VTFDRVQSTMNRLNNLATSIKPESTTGRFRLEAAGGDRWRGDVDFDLHYGPDPFAFWRLGVRSVGNNGVLDLQRAFPLNHRSYVRAGVIGSRLGAGMDYEASPRVVWEAEAWNPTDPRLDLRLYYQIVPGMQLTTGLYRTFNKNEPFVGFERDVPFGP